MRMQAIEGRLGVMMRFPSQIPRSRRAKVMRLAIALAALAVFAASVLGLAYALKPVADEAPDAWPVVPSGLQSIHPATEPATSGVLHARAMAPDAAGR